MTTQENYIRRIQQGATVPSMRAIFGQAWLEAITDADERRRHDPLVTIEDALAAYLHDVCGIDRNVTRLIDPLDYYLYITTSPEER